MKKIKPLNSKILFLLIGVLISLGIYTVQAAWDDQVGSGDTLTVQRWNDVRDKLVELDNNSWSNCTSRIKIVGNSGDGGNNGESSDCSLSGDNKITCTDGNGFDYRIEMQVCTSCNGNTEVCGDTSTINLAESD